MQAVHWVAEVWQEAQGEVQAWQVEPVKYWLGVQ
jgi:hypothetical protein